jgi:hypothetical protein
MSPHGVTFVRPALHHCRAVVQQSLTNGRTNRKSPYAVNREMHGSVRERTCRVGTVYAAADYAAGAEPAFPYPGQDASISMATAWRF